MNSSNALFPFSSSLKTAVLNKIFLHTTFYLSNPLIDFIFPALTDRNSKMMLHHVFPTLLTVP